jgi:hypothetical protein
LSLGTVLASSVVRGTVQGESHGGLFLVDLDRGTAEMKLDWNRADIDTAGRGGDRGLRGIGFHRERVIVAANAEILVLDLDFNLVDSFSNRYLQHCHEISVFGSRLFVASTGYDSVLSLDLISGRFVAGWQLSLENRVLRLIPFDPADAHGPQPSDRFHLNSVKTTTNGVYFSGTRVNALLQVGRRALARAGRIPYGTHNAQPLENGILYNDTHADRVCYQRSGSQLEMSVPQVERCGILNIDRFSSEVARPGFARGLACIAPGIVAAGSSPSTVSAYELATGSRLAMHNLSMDVRNAIHGLARWPF